MPHKKRACFRQFGRRAKQATIGLYAGNSEQRRTRLLENYLIIADFRSRKMRNQNTLYYNIKLSEPRNLGRQKLKQRGSQMQNVRIRNATME